MNKGNLLFDIEMKAVNKIINSLLSESSDVEPAIWVNVDILKLRGKYFVC